MSETKETKDTKKEVNPFLFRYPPCSMSLSLQNTKKTIEVEIVPEDFGDSITDKESYRLSLASMRGDMASLGGSGNVGQYMFEDGKYDIHKDFSYILRKDLSIVEIDEYTERLKKQLEAADESLKNQIESEIKALNEKKEDIIQAKENKTDSAE